MVFVDAVDKDRTSTRVSLAKLVKHQYMILAGIILIGVVLRFYKLGEWGLWGDEAITIKRAQNLFEYGISRWSPSRLLAYLVFSLFGNDEWSARLVPSLTGMVSLPILYFPIRKIFGVSAALLSTFLLSLSPWHLYWSQNARFYTVLLLFYTLALLAFYFWMERDRPRYLIAFLLFAGLAMHERLIAVFLVPVVLLYLLSIQILPFEKPRGFNRRNITMLFVIGLVLGGIFAYPHVRNPSKWVESFGWINNNPFWILAGVLYYTRIPVIGMAAVGTLYLLSKKDRAGLLFGLNAVLPTAVIMVISLVHYTANRYIFVSLVTVIVLASVATVELFRQSRSTTKLLVAGVLLILSLDTVGETILYYNYQNGNRDNWKEAFAFVEAHRQPDDMVVVRQQALAEYYLGERVVPIQRVELAQLEAHDGRVWFVEDMVAADAFPQVHGWLDTNAQLVAVLDVHANARNFRMRVYLYDPAVRVHPTTSWSHPCVLAASTDPACWPDTAGSR